MAREFENVNIDSGISVNFVQKKYTFKNWKQKYFTMLTDTFEIILLFKSSKTHFL